MEDIEVNVCVPVDAIANALCSALEGGSNYWYMIQKTKEPKEFKYYGSFNESKTKYQYLFPFNSGALYINDEIADNGPTITPVCVCISTIKSGLNVMANEYPKHFSDLKDETGDAITGDVFLQCVVFGKVIYG